jgi:hypothetical protein
MCFLHSLTTQTTSFQVNADASEKDIFVNVTRQSLLSNTYTNVNSQMSVTNSTRAFITTNVPTTDFTDCIYVKRTIILPQSALQNVNIQINIWKSDVRCSSTLFTVIGNIRRYRTIPQCCEFNICRRCKQSQT